jgi:hypothetical protein
LRTPPVIDWFDWPDRPRRQPAQASGHLDWNLRTGGFGSVIGSPAKYSFDITASNCSDVI